MTNRQKVTRRKEIADGVSIPELYITTEHLFDPRIVAEDDFGDIILYVEYKEDETDAELNRRLANEAKAEKSRQAAKEKRRLRLLELKEEFPND